jgi:hypothetical protein
LGVVVAGRGTDGGGMGWLGVSGGCHSGVCCLKSMVFMVVVCGMRLD